MNRSQISYKWLCFKNWIALHIAKRLPMRVKYWSIVETNVNVWAKLGNITPDQVTYNQLMDHHDPDKEHQWKS